MLSRCWDSATWETWYVGPGRSLSCRRRLFSTRCNIHLALMLMSVSVCLSVSLWRSALWSRCMPGRGEGSSRAMLATARLSCLTGYSRRWRQEIGLADSVDLFPSRRTFTRKMCCCWCRGSARRYDCSGLRFPLVIYSKTASTFANVLYHTDPGLRTRPSTRSTSAARGQSACSPNLR